MSDLPPFVCPNPPSVEGIGSQIKSLDRRIADLEAALKEACDEYDYAATYKGQFLREKHCDDETLARLRSVLVRGVAGDEKRGSDG